MATSMDSISCSICLDPLKDPVAIPCGHSYCMACIKDYWDQDYQKGVYSCPQCRQTFIPRPVLNTNTLLAELVESLKKTGLQAAPLAHCYAGPGDVECDVCTGRKLKAVKSCLECLASYCETHLQPHYESPTFKKHKLVKASTQLQEKICSRHDKLLEMYCRTDQQIICYLCMIGDHKGHDTVSAESERAERQRQRGEKQRIQKIEKEMQTVRRSVKSLKRSAQAAVEESEKIFTELICTFERRCSEVKELIKAQEKAAVSQAEGLLKQLEQEIAKLRRRDAELEQLSHTEDHIHFLQTLQSLCVSPGSEALLSITVNQHVSFEDVKKSVSELKNQIEVICSGEIAMISAKNSCQLTLDPNTANNWLCLSEGNRKVTWSPWSNKAQPYPDHPDRFSTYEQVLCREGLSGTCYWEVEWSAFKAYIAISYKGIGRIGRGDECWFGGNDQSWSLVCCSLLGCYFYHNNKRTAIHVPRSSRIVGVYLDHRAGTLSFYSVSDTMTLLHRVQTTFNQPLYPGFWIYAGSSVKILNQ
ncbi:tripartite motif-containing protein 16-like isoform X2 [Oncorhynchus kisutch]|uniref:Tripartite motif-containing protein 16-like n=1 Tax=Oncorhynchus kisutch TaxID=8019 RepID=A0A8C7FL95_ONCKI|nr:tripartite motif-containing protein 16-like isoform X2 [Oncorhynchus kisutch]